MGGVYRNQLIADTTEQIQVSCVGFCISLGVSKQRLMPSLKNILFLVLLVKGKGLSLILVQESQNVGVVFFFL